MFEDAWRLVQEMHDGCSRELQLSLYNMMEEEKLKIKNHLLKDAKAQYHFRCVRPDGKSYQQSSETRELGNKLYLQQNHNRLVHEKILSLYNKSLAFAPNNSEAQATAWYNKSALLQHFDKFSESITEIDKALKITKSDSLRIKLLCRRAECLTSLGSTENQKNLEKAKFSLSKFKNSKKVEDSLKKVIEKTEIVVMKGLLKVPKKNKAKAQKLKMIADVKNMDISCLVKFNYSKKFGIHLVAARNFKPGEILVVEDPFCSIINATNHACYLYCSHCSQILWTSTPCDQCTWCMFCSEQCKNQAWAEYHDLECQVMSSILKMTPIAYPYAQLSLRIFIKALREAGSISELATDLLSIIVNTDRNKIISSDVKLEGYKCLYSLLGNATPQEDKTVTQVSAITLIALAKHSSIFGTKFDMDSVENEVEKLLKNDEAVFVGALLLKTCKIAILNLNSTVIRNLDCNSPPASKPQSFCQAECCSKDGYIAPKVSSITMNCTPNVGRSVTFDNTVIIYALKPIKEGEQLFDSIYSLYRKFAPLAERQKAYRKRYGCPCNCQTCTNKWTRKSFVQQEVPQRSAAQVNRVIDEMMLMQIRRDRGADCDIEALNMMKEGLDVLWKHLKLPSLFLITGVTSLMKLFFDVYSEKSKIPDKCGR